jgi:hypothetical protein
MARLGEQAQTCRQTLNHEMSLSPRASLPYRSSISPEGRKDMTLLLRISSLALLLTALPLSAIASAAAGSTGILDPASVALAATNGPALQFAAGQTGTITARYPVVNTYGSATSKTPAWSVLGAGYNAGGGTVSIRLIRHTECSTSTLELCSISATSGTSNQCRTCLFADGVNFSAYIYYVEVTLTRTSTSQDPKLHNVSLQ